MGKFEQLSYYEELGIDPGATSEQVRDAFRSLVRLLHPDHHSDPQMKALAERQMRKLNMVYAILSDPERRRRYDDFLEEDPTPTIVVNPASNIDVRRLAMRAAWIATAIATVAILVWMSSDGPPQQPSTDVKAADVRRAQPEPAPPSGASAIALPEELARLRSALRAARSQRDAALAEVNRLLARQSADRKGFSLPTAESEAATMTELPRTGGKTAAAAQQMAFGPIPTASAMLQLQGTWTYTRPKDAVDRVGDLYSPEFIEATIYSVGDRLKGQYRSRYRVLDRAISPDVYFQFEVSAKGPTIVGPWLGRGGAKGELTLRLAEKNALQLDWEASELGTAQGLVSGSATLARRREPREEQPVQ